MAIKIINNGPLVVDVNDGSLEGAMTVISDQDGNRFNLKDKEKVYLCRCGHSAKKPFCDGKHKLNNFVSEIKAE